MTVDLRRESFVKPVGFNVSFREVFSPDSIVIISWSKTEGYSMLDQDRESKSSSLVESIVNGVHKFNFSNIPEFWEETMTTDQDTHTVIICCDRERCVVYYNGESES